MSRDPRLTVLLDPAGTTLSALGQRSAVAAALEGAGMEPVAAAAKSELFARAAAGLIEDGHDPAVPAHALFVPGRIEVLGKHTDYCGGRSLLCTVDRGICMVGVARADQAVRIRELARDGRIEFPFRADLTPPAGHWSNYPMTVVRRLAKNFPGHTGGAQIALLSDLPQAGGLSSSSALVTGVFILFARLNRLDQAGAWGEHFPDIESLAGYCGCIENGASFGRLEGTSGVGTFGGSQDHTAILCCRSGVLSLYRFGPVRHEQDVPLPQPLRFGVHLSGVIAEKTRDAMAKFNAVSCRARRVVSLWNERTGENQPHLAAIFESAGAAEPPQTSDRYTRLLEMIDGLADERPDQRLLLRRRLEQFVAESYGIIPQVVQAIGRGDWDRLGCLVDRSHGLAETHLGNQVPQTSALQHQARSAGALAASAFGAGFGGSVWSLRSGCDGESPDSFSTRPGIPLVIVRPRRG